ncbi:MAG: hypothetical protein LBV50_12545 [Novosphingobium sp.]|nr:hypothetical protein [Novosphingobium sp.]
MDKAMQGLFGTRIINNVHRGLLVEAMVALALEPEWRWCSGGYNGWDFDRADGLKLEVKHSAARQFWPRAEPSKPVFRIAQNKTYWDSERSVDIALTERPAALYVFAYHAGFDDQIDQRDPQQWQFYVVLTCALPPAKTASLQAVEAITAPVHIPALADEVCRVASQVCRDKSAGVTTEKVGTHRGNHLRITQGPDGLIGLVISKGRELRRIQGDDVPRLWRKLLAASHQCADI